MRMLISGVVTTGVLVARVAGADPGADGFRPALDEHGYLTLDASQVLDDHDVSFGIGALEWGHHDVGTTMPVADAMTATLVGAVGLRLAGVPFELVASAPFSTASDGQGVGDLGFHVKTQLIDGRKHAFGVAVIGRLYVPTASGAERMPDDSVVPEVGLVLDKRVGPARFTLDGGVRWQGMDRELPVGAGAALAITPGKLEVLGELTGTYGLATAQPLEALAGVKVYLARSSYLTIGAGHSVDAATPDLRAFIGIVFEPKSAALAPAFVVEPPPVIATHEQPAKDDDNLPDTQPSCVDDSTQPGCLDLTQVVDTGSTLVTLEPINFEFDKAVIAADSHRILDTVAATLHDNPDIQLIEIQGHTDERGNAAYNLDLSDRRAAAVVDYLVSRGVARTRLESHGYGSTVPVDPAHDNAAWTKNRRVAFVIKNRM